MDNLVITAACLVALAILATNITLTIWMIRRYRIAIGFYLLYLFLGPPVENMTWTKFFGRIGYLLGCLAVGVYFGFAGWAYYNTDFTSNQCRTPYVSFLATWPLWAAGIMNEHRDFGLVSWSLGQCVRGDK